MRHTAMMGFLALWAVAVSPGVSGQDPSDNAGFTPLFNGKDLTGFKTFLDPKAGDADPAKTWTVEDGTMRTQRTLRSTLDKVVTAAAAAGVRPPAVIVIGPVAGLAPQGHQP